LAPLGSGWIAVAAYLAACFLLVAAATYDAHWMELPDIISWLLFAAGALRIIGDGLTSGAWGPVLLNAALGAAVAGGFFGLQYVASRGRWIGSGDIILGAAAGLLVGWPGSLLALVVAYVAGAAVAVPLLAMRRRGWSTAVAFGPFIAVGTLVAMTFGPELTQLLGWT
jgi:prepilin signal peptidase PulO-like enzyme (type II secretory pathway)